MFGFREKREAVFTNSTPQSFAEIVLGLGDNTDIIVNSKTAMQVPAYACGVNFLSGVLAGLPLHAYERSRNGRKKVKGPLASLLHDAANPEMSSFDWRKCLFHGVFTERRGLTYIERDAKGQVVNLWPIDPKCVTVKRDGYRKVYDVQDGKTLKRYAASEIIDIPFMLQADGLNSHSSLENGKEVLKLALAATKYGTKFFNNGGVPPFVINGNFTTPKGLARASDDLQKAVRKASKEDRLALTLPDGLEVKPLGVNPEDSQMVETQRFLIEEIARLLSMPPSFLQDLTHGTFSNTEQQDLHFVKHTVKRWAEQFEQEVNLKLFGRSNTKFYVEFNMDGLLRGDFITRMNGYSQAIMAGHLKPSESRERENLPFVDGSDRLFMQSATVPIEMAGFDAGVTNAGE